MESVTAIVESSDLLGQVFLVLELDGGVAEYLGLVLGVCEAHIVSEVCHKLALAQVVLLVEIRLLLLESLQHGLIVSGCIHKAHGVQVLGLLVIRVSIEHLGSRSAVEHVRGQGEGLGVCWSLLSGRHLSIFIIIITISQFH